MFFPSQGNPPLLYHASRRDFPVSVAFDGHFESFALFCRPISINRLRNSMAVNYGDGATLAFKGVVDYLKAAERTAFKVGGTWRFRTADIDGWIADQSKKAEGTD